MDFSKFDDNSDLILSSDTDEDLDGLVADGRLIGYRRYENRGTGGDLVVLEFPGGKSLTMESLSKPDHSMSVIMILVNECQG